VNGGGPSELPSLCCWAMQLGYDAPAMPLCPSPPRGEHHVLRQIDRHDSSPTWALRNQPTPPRSEIYMEKTLMN
jgi:hypothetical protein